MDRPKEVEKPRETEDSIVPVGESAPSTAPASTAPASNTPATTKSSWNGDVGRSERGSWSHDGYAELAREEDRRAAARERQAAIARGRGRGMVRGMFRGRGRGAFPVPATRPESVDTEAPLEETMSTTDTPPVVKLPESAFVPPTSDHEPSAITEHLQTQAEHAERVQQQELAQRQKALEDDMRRLEIGQQRVQSLGASSDAGSSTHQQQPTMLPPGIGMTESGAFFDVVTGQAVVWVPSPSPGPIPPASYGAAMNNRMGYNPYAPSPEMGMGYGYPPQIGYQTQYSGYPRSPHHDPYYQPSFIPGRDSVSPYPMPGYNMHAPPPPQLGDPTYFMPPRPQSKIQIRAPPSGDASAPGHPNSAEIAAATLKDPSKHGARSPEVQAQGNAYGYQPMMNAQYMQHAQQGYYPQQYMPMGY